MSRKFAIAVSLSLLIAGAFATYASNEAFAANPSAANEPNPFPYGVQVRTSDRGPNAAAPAIRPAGSSLAARLKATTDAVTAQYAENHNTAASPAATPAAAAQPSPYRTGRTNAPRPLSALQQTAAPLPAQAELGQPMTGAQPIQGYSSQPTNDPAVQTVGGVRSVLKRSMGPVVDEARPPVFAPPQPQAFTPDVEQPAAEMSQAPVEDVVEPTGPTARRTPNFGARAGGELLAPRSIQELALTARSPSLRVSVAGPQAITVGKSSTFVVNLFNDSDSDANQVVVRAALPAWVTVNSGETTVGSADVETDAKGISRLAWSIANVPAKSNQTLRLQLTPSQGQPFELALEWVAQPTIAKATISVHQPQLQLSLAGPADMNFGEEKIVTMNVSNPGTGDADHVVLSVASGDARPQQIEIGSLQAGMQKEIAVKVVANHAGEMSLSAVVVGDGDLRAEAKGKIVVRRAELALAVEGPELKYAGTDASYVITLANRGDSPADNVMMTIGLPSGAKYLAGPEGVTPNATAVKWKVPSLAPGAEGTFEIKVQLNAMGANRFTAQANTENGLSAASQTETMVEAISDLKLAVNDPAGPIAVGNETTYELHLVNRGTKQAGEVRVVMQFGEGIEPIGVEGAEGRVVPGQLICEPLPQLAAGEKVTLKVRAKADRPGTHQFRVEVTTADNETRLVTEGTSRFFADGGRSTDAAARTARGPSPLQPSNVPQALQR